MAADDESKTCSTLTKIRFYASILFYITIMFCGSFFYLTVQILFGRFFPKFTMWYLWTVFQLFRIVIGVKPELRDTWKLKSAPKGVIVMNHQSLWDFYMVCSIYHYLGDSVHTVSRKEVFYLLGPLGYAMLKSGSLFIDRSTPNAAFNHLLAEARKIFSPSNPKSAKIILFPEGTRNQNLDDFLPFKRGAFKLAATMNVPIVPIVCAPQTSIKSSGHFKPGKMALQCLDPVTLDLNNDLDGQIEKIRSDMLVVFKQLAKEEANSSDS